MKITLRKTHKLITKITQRIGELEFEGTTIEFSAFRETITDRDIVSRLEKGYLVNTMRFNHILNLMLIRATVRRLVQEQNETFGINDLIAKRKHMKDVLTFLNEHHQAKENQMSVMPEDIRGRMEAVKLAAGCTSSAYGSPTTVVVVSTISSELAEINQSRIRKAQNDLDDIEEELTALNGSTKVFIDDDTVEVLQNHKILS